MKSADRLPDRKLFHIPCLAVWRHLAGITQTELAARVGVEQSTIGRIECGFTKRSYGFMVNRFASVLGVPAPALLIPAPVLLRRLETLRPAGGSDGKAA